MKISEAISKIKSFYKGGFDVAETRDRVLYGENHLEEDCTGIATTCWATYEVIKEAHRRGANLIICHEALFWNHGDHQIWLAEEQNKTYIEKKKLLDETGIVVWRNHDYIHSGMKSGRGIYEDGIFLAFAQRLGWQDYVTDKCAYPMTFQIKPTRVEDIIDRFITGFNLNGLRYIGDKELVVSKVFMCMHLFGADNEFISKVDHEDFDLIIPGETIDFTLLQYLFDTNIIYHNKAAIIPGHFNMEEPGMEYMVEYLPEIIGKIPCSFIKSQDMYHYVSKETNYDR